MKHVKRKRRKRGGVSSLLSVFGEMPGPRIERKKARRLEVLMFIALCSCLSGGKGFNAMEDYARARKAWLKRRINV